MSTQRRVIVLAVGAMVILSLACQISSPSDSGSEPEIRPVPSETEEATETTAAPAKEATPEEPTSTPQPTIPAGEGGCSGPAIIVLDHVDWAAYQTGSGPWTAVEASQLEAGEVAVPVDGDCKYSIAYVCRQEFKEDEDVVHIYHYAADEAALTRAGEGVRFSWEQ